MNRHEDALRSSVIEYCAAIGADPLLVQGAGGNISWKESETLWVKASGTWLKEAVKKDIFVPVDLPHTLSVIARGDFSAAPRLREETKLRPSIETLLHALMPHQVVVHLHPVEILAHLVRDDCRAAFLSLSGIPNHWAMVDYHKPGAALAAAVSAALANRPDIDVVFMKNHGIVVGGEDVAEVNRTLGLLLEVLSTPSAALRKTQPFSQSPISGPVSEYVPIEDIDVQQLALNAELFNRLSTEWALYPDHVVFLGARAHAYPSWEAFGEANPNGRESPKLVFIRGEGVFARPPFGAAKHAQLRCYFDVLTRLRPGTTIRELTDAQISELLNWDAEQYRMRLAT